MAKRRNSSLLEVSFTGTLQDFRSGVCEVIDPQALISSEYMGDEQYLNAVDLSKTQVHTISACNLSCQSQSDPMTISVVAAKGAQATNAHLNTLRMGGRGNNQLVLMSTRSSNVVAGEETVYAQNEHAGSSKILLFPIEKLREPQHTSIIPEQDGTKTVLMLSDEAIQLFEKGMEAIFEADHPGETVKMDLWEMKRRFDRCVTARGSGVRVCLTARCGCRPEIPEQAYNTVIGRLAEMNEKSSRAVSDLSGGLGLSMRLNTLNPRGWTGQQTFTIKIRVDHTPAMK